MRIDINDLIYKKIILKEKIDDYELAHINFNNTLNEISSYWNSPRAQKLFNNMYEIKKEIDSNIIYLKNIYNIYDKIGSKYSKFGENLYVDLKEKKNIIDIIERNMNKLYSLKNVCNRIYNTCPNAEYIIKKTNEEILLLNNLKRNIIDDFEYIEEIEKLISEECANIEFKDISSLNIEVSNE